MVQTSIRPVTINLPHMSSNFRVMIPASTQNSASENLRYFFTSSYYILKRLPLQDCH